MIGHRQWLGWLMLDLSESDVVLVSVLAHGIFGAGRHGGNERRLRMNVIVEPDSTAGWFTVAGGVLGGLTDYRSDVAATTLR